MINYLNEKNRSGFESHPDFISTSLTEEYLLWTARLPKEQLDFIPFQELWASRPDDFSIIKMLGKDLPSPRWTQAYGKDYKFSGNVNEALSVPPLLQNIHSWCKSNIDKRLNGLLVNWYDGQLDHYIGKHRDSTIQMIEGVPIVTISLGDSRVFRLRPFRGKGFTDFPVDNGTIIVLPYATNKAFTHEIPKGKKYRGQRISITLRGFE